MQMQRIKKEIFVPQQANRLKCILFNVEEWNNYWMILDSVIDAEKKWISGQDDVGVDFVCVGSYSAQPTNISFINLELKN